jgi:hypothetical protein
LRLLVLFPCSCFSPTETTKKKDDDDDDDDEEEEEEGDDLLLLSRDLFFGIWEIVRCWDQRALLLL